MSFIREVTIPSILVWAIAWGIFIGAAVLFFSNFVPVIAGGAIGSLLYVVAITIIGLYND